MDKSGNLIMCILTERCESVNLARKMKQIM